MEKMCIEDSYPSSNLPKPCYTYSMKKIIIGIVAAVVCIAAAWYVYNNVLQTTAGSADTATTSSPLDIAYIVDGEQFTLVNGVAEKDIITGSATKNTLSIFGEPSFGDIDGDGDEDAVVLLVNNSGGSGTFYYVAIAVNIDGVYTATDTMLLGDRIAPQTFAIEGNKAVVNYVVRNSGEDFSVQPSVGKSLYVQYDPATLQLIQIAVDFEGEANPDMMSLTMQQWTWVQTTYNNDTKVVPQQADAFTLTFNNDSTVAITTDCNTMGGTYTVTGNNITFGPIASTKMFCEGSQEQDFAAMLPEMQSFFFTSKGELVFDLRFDTGSAIFR